MPYTLKHDPSTLPALSPASINENKWAYYDEADEKQAYTDAAMENSHLRQRVPLVLVSCTALLLSITFSLAVWLSVIPMVLKLDAFTESALGSISTYNSIISVMASLLMAMYVFALGRGAASVLQHRITRQGVTIKQVGALVKFGRMGFPLEWLGSTFTLSLLVSFACGPAFSGAIQAAFGAVPTTLLDPRTAWVASLDNAVQFLNESNLLTTSPDRSQADYDPIALDGLLDNLKLADQLDGTITASLGGAKIQGNSSAGFLSTSYFAQQLAFAAMPTFSGGNEEDHRITDLRSDAGLGVSVQGVGIGFWANTTCTQLQGVQASFLLADRPESGVSVANVSAPEADCNGYVPYGTDSQVQGSYHPFICPEPGSNSLYIAHIDLSSDGGVMLFDCTTQLTSQVQHYQVSQAETRVLSAGPWSPVDSSTSQALVSYLDTSLLANVGPAGLRQLPLATEKAIEVHTGQEDVTVANLIGWTLEIVYGVYAAAITEYTTAQLNRNGSTVLNLSTSASGGIGKTPPLNLTTLGQPARSQVVVQVPVVRIGLGRGPSHNLIGKKAALAWLVALAMPTLVALVMLGIVARLGLHSCDLTDPVAVILNSVDGGGDPARAQAGEEEKQKGDSAQRGTEAARIVETQSTKDMSQLRVYLRATAGEQGQRAYLTTERPVR